MKIAVKAGIFILAIIITMLIAMGLISDSTRAGESENALASSVEQALEQIKSEGGYAIENPQELIADFNRRLLLQVNSDSDIQVEVLKADPEMGVLDVRVTETYLSVKGKKKETVCRKTVFLEEYTDNEGKEYHTIRFQVGDKLYRKYTAYTGTKLVEPGIPTMEGRKFLYWKQEGKEEPADLENITAESNLSFRAVFE